jgi:hypothetical protein
MEAIEIRLNPSVLRFFSPKPQVFTMNFDTEDWIPRQKDDDQQWRSLSNDHAMSSAISYLSTNDLLTSWFFTLCQCDYGFMSVNFRNRIQILDDRLGWQEIIRIVFCIALEIISFPR